MRIETVQWLSQFEEKINVKHQLTRSEVEEVLFNRPSVRFVEYGDQAGEDLYAVDLFPNKSPTVDTSVYILVVEINWEQV